MIGVEQDEMLRVYRNPGDLRGIIRVRSGGNPAIDVELFPAVTMEFDEQDKLYVAICECFDLVGTGAVKDDALEALKITARVFLSELLENNCLHETLQMKKWEQIDVLTTDEIVRQMNEAEGHDRLFTPHIAVSGSVEGQPFA
jgi:hypothetical protein